MKPKKIVITSGDVDGIGLEVAEKALKQIQIAKEGLHILLLRSDRSALRSSLGMTSISKFDEFLQHSAKESQIFDLPNSRSPVDWFLQSVELAKEGHVQAIVTAPMSKTLIAEEGYQEIGHTELIRRITKVEKPLMVFFGEKFNVLLGTGHIPLNEVPKHLNEEHLHYIIKAAHELKRRMKWEKPIAVLGLNPHSGEQGLIGDEEALLEKVLLNFPEVDGPLVPDAAFLPKNWDTYCLYVSLYHDQGLIPFKLIHGHDSGVHLTYGINFVRTSVDHGTAKEIYGLNQANPASMLQAIEKAIELCPED